MWSRPSWRKHAESIVTIGLALLLAPGLAAADSQRSTPHPTLLVMGDSLSAAYGLAVEQGWVHLLGERLAQRAPRWRVVNASVSGETTAGGAARMQTALRQHTPDLVAIELGANDALRGLPIEQASANLLRMIVASKASGAEVLLIGIQLPPNYGPDYAEALRTMYLQLATEQDTALLPFLLQPIAAERDAFLPDNLHPDAPAQPRILEHVWPVLLPLLEQVEHAR